MRRADRLFQIVQLLRVRKLCTAAWLAEELSVSTRTVYRDIADLIDSGVPVRGEAGVGYALERGFELPPLTFRHDELEALVLGARVVVSRGDPELAEAAKSLLNKVAAVVPASLRESLASTALYAPTTARHEVSEHLGPLRAAVARKRKVQFAYTTPRGATSERIVQPVGLHFWGWWWSLAGWCELREDWRNFRLDRMTAVAVLDDLVDDAHGGLAAYMVAVDAEANEEGWGRPKGLG